jgi:hypothetical protein
MSEKPLTEMDYTEFQELMDAYITRSSQQDDALPAPTFLGLLFDILSQRVQNVIRLEGQVINGELVLAPTEEETPVQVRGNQILLGDWQVIVTLKNDKLQPA